MAYNPYFPGGSIAMPQQLFPDSVEYEDGWFKLPPPPPPPDVSACAIPFPCHCQQERVDKQEYNELVIIKERAMDMLRNPYV